MIRSFARVDTSWRLLGAILVGALAACGAPSEADPDPIPIGPGTVRDASVDETRPAVTDEGGAPTTDSGVATKKRPLVWEALDLRLAPNVAQANGHAWSVAGTDSRVYVALTEYETAAPFSRGRVLASSDQGATWSAAFTAPLDYSMVMGVWATGTTEAFAVGATTYTAAGDIYTSAIFHTTDGAAWTTTPRTNGVLEAVWGSGFNDVYAVGYKGTSAGAQQAIVEHSIDGGKTWTTVASPEINKLKDLRGVWGTGPKDVYVSGNGAGVGGAILRSTDGGATWSPVLTSTKSSFWSVYGVPAKSHLFTAAFDGTVFHSTDNGAHWSSGKLAGIWGGLWGDGDWYYVAGKTAAGNPTMQVSSDGGDLWKADTLPDAIAKATGSFTAISATSQAIYASGGGRTTKPFLLRALQ
jgi:photosystem II stability/assembly factor-like uncharacterized protein